MGSKIENSVKTKSASGSRLSNLCENQQEEEIWWGAAILGEGASGHEPLLPPVAALQLPGGPGQRLHLAVGLRPASGAVPEPGSRPRTPHLHPEHHIQHDPRQS